MATTDTYELADECRAFLADYYRDAIGTLAQHYPQEQRSLVVDYGELYQYDQDLARDYLEQPEEIHPALEEGLAKYDLPVDMDLAGAHVRVGGLPDEATFYPDEFSPTKEAGQYRTIRGDVLVSTDTYSKVEVAAFECERCGTPTKIPQTSDSWQEPHECQGCERQGPFSINFERSEFVDGETIQLQTPPERANGTGRTLQVFVEDDLCGRVEMGDRIAVSGILHLHQQRDGRQKRVEFEPYLEGRHLEIEEATQADLDIDAETRERVQSLADGTEGDPLTVAAESFHPKIHGHIDEKKALILAVIGGATNTPDVRGEFHVLFIGDPSTGKSELVNRVGDVAARSVSVSSTDTSSAGLTSTATQGEFSDGRWTLSPGAFVKANEGVVVIDELDDMDPADRKSMLEPMANQQINVSKAGINATLSTQTAVVAAANPVHSRFDPYEPLDEQFGFESNLISRFDLVFTFRDQPDEDEDAVIAEHTARYHDAKIRQHRGDELDSEQAAAVEKPVDDETLRAWLALANQQPDPVFVDESVRETLTERFVALRGMNGYSEDAEVPVTHRKQRGVERIARAHAKLEFSPVVTERHAEQAMALVGQSMQDYQTTEDGTYDADIAETGRSKAQHDLVKAVEEEIQQRQEEGEEYHAEREAVAEALSDVFDADEVQHEIDQLMKSGEAIEPETGAVRYIGRY